MVPAEEHKSGDGDHDQGAGKGIGVPRPPAAGVVVEPVEEMQDGATRELLDVDRAGGTVEGRCAAVEEYPELVRGGGVVLTVRTRHFGQPKQAEGRFAVDRLRDGPGRERDAALFQPVARFQSLRWLIASRRRQ
jgi:hypothetical protein